MDRNPLAASDKAHRFIRCCLDVYLLRLDLQCAPKKRFYLGGAWPNLGGLGEHRDVEISDGPTVVSEQTIDFLHKLNARSVFVPTIRRWEVLSDIAQTCCAEQGIADGVEQGIGIGVAEESEGGVGKQNAAQPQSPSFHQLVDIVAMAYTKRLHP